MPFSALSNAKDSKKTQWPRIKINWQKVVNSFLDILSNSEYFPFYAPIDVEVLLLTIRLIFQLIVIDNMTIILSYEFNYVIFRTA